MSVALHVNVDHVATLRQARGGHYPDPVHAAVLCERACADGITVHLREDRRHISLRDVEVLRAVVTTRLNLEMAATEEMLEIALRIRPDIVTLVPERREERTTEGGLPVAELAQLPAYIARLQQAGIPVSLFIDPDEKQVRASALAKAHAIELHTGSYAHDPSGVQLQRLIDAASFAHASFPELHIAAGHGLHLRNIRALVEHCPAVEELNIGHALVSDAIFEGLEVTVGRYLGAIADAEARR